MTSSSSGHPGRPPRPGAPLWTPVSEMPTQRLPHLHGPFVPAQRSADDPHRLPAGYPLPLRAYVAPAVATRSHRTAWPLVTLTLLLLFALGLLAAVAL